MTTSMFAVAGSASLGAAGHASKSRVEAIGSTCAPRGVRSSATIGVSLVDVRHSEVPIGLARDPSQQWEPSRLPLPAGV